MSARILDPFGPLLKSRKLVAVADDGVEDVRAVLLSCGKFAYVCRAGEPQLGVAHGGDRFCDTNLRKFGRSTPGKSTGTQSVGACSYFPWASTNSVVDRDYSRVVNHHGKILQK